MPQSQLYTPGTPYFQVPDAVAAAEPSSIQISNVKVRKDYNPKGMVKLKITILLTTKPKGNAVNIFHIIWDVAHYNMKSKEEQNTLRIR